MLTLLTIQNFGLIDQAALEFQSGLNILTGETGAGKSILIDALRFALGDRQSSSIIRDPSKPCTVEAVFKIIDKNLKSLDLFREFLEESDDSSLIIYRSLQSDGRNKIKINGLSVTVNQLKELGNHLIDFHGPHDHQMLLSTLSHQSMLDKLIDFGKIMADYRINYKEYKNLRSQESQINQMAQTREREIDLLTYQVKELGQVPLDQNHYEELKQSQAKANNAQKLFTDVNQLIELLEGENEGINERLREAFLPMKHLNHIDEKTTPLHEQLSQIQGLTEGLTSELHDYANTLSFEPDQAEEINTKCDIYENILKKYGPDMDHAKEFFATAQTKLDLLENFEQNSAHLQEAIKASQKKLKTAAQKITKEREKASGLLKKTIEKELSELGMPHVKFEVKLEPIEFNEHGTEQVVFYISPNAGETLKPLADIVSSGEAARVMLGLKKALIKVDPIPVLIFDEIDAQIGGRLGTTTGQKLKEISDKRQVILITHLPQIASFADAHFKVSKIVKSGRTLTTVNLLDKDTQVKEIAKMMSGERETDIALQHAHDMLTKAKG